MVQEPLTPGMLFQNRFNGRFMIGHQKGPQANLLDTWRSRINHQLRQPNLADDQQAIFSFTKAF